MDNTVVKLFVEDRIGRVAMEDRESSNTFSHRLITDLIQVFEEIAQNQDIRVVLLHGYDNYFCCGGSKSELIGISEGKIRFTDLNFFDLPLQCDLPVIAAMNGHALGGGLAFGCYADIIVMGEECVYSANFMKYGFTPGMGATYIIPEKFGKLLGTEMLLRAESYYGRELKERGAQPKIVRKKDVIDTAMGMAADLADKPLFSLKTLKRFMAGPIREALPSVIAAEIKMHDATFTRPEVRQRIETLFGGMSRMS